MATGTVDYNEYTYTYDTSAGTCSARVTEGKRNQEYYSGLFDEIIVDGVICKLTSLVTSNYGCFEQCTSLKYPPRIPSTVTNMKYCFYNCQALLYPPTIPYGVTDLSSCFYNCIHMWEDIDINLQLFYKIPDTVTTMVSCFVNCYGMKAAPAMSAYNGLSVGTCFSGCSALQYVGGFPLVNSSSISSCFSICPSLRYGPEIIDTTGVNRFTSAYTGTTLTSGNLVTPKEPISSSTNETMSLKKLLTKLIDSNMFTSTIKSGLTYAAMVTIPAWRATTNQQYLFNCCRDSFRYQSFSANNIKYYTRAQDDGFWRGAVSSTFTSSITYIDNYNVRRTGSATLGHDISITSPNPTSSGTFGSILQLQREGTSNLICNTGFNSGTAENVTPAYGSVFAYGSSSTSDGTLAAGTHRLAGVLICGGPSIDRKPISPIAYS